MEQLGVEMVSVGDELLDGRTVDTNAATLGRFLRGHGVEVRRRVTVPDDLAAIIRALDDALGVDGEGPRLVVVSGGLGPTTDDITRQAAARLLGVDVIVDEPAAAAIRANRAALGRPYNDGERRMASLPAGATLVHNAVGVAPGFAVARPARDGVGSSAVFLPGVPREFEAMLPGALEPFLRAASGGPGQRAVTYSVFGVPESELDERLRALGEPEDVRFQYGVRFPVVRVTLVARGEAARGDAWARCARRFREALGDAAYGEGDVSLAEVVVGHLRRLGWRLATAESCTGGLVAHLLTEVPGASDVFDLGWVTYSNDQKRDRLGVPQGVLDRVGAVSRETVEAMARGAREGARADLAVAISGIAGPGGGTVEKPVGTVHLALATPDGIEWHERRFAGSRSAVKSLTAATALDLTRRYCEGRRA